MSRSSCVSYSVFPICLLPGTLEPCLPRCPPLCLPLSLPPCLPLCLPQFLPFCLPPCCPTVSPLSLTVLSPTFSRLSPAVSPALFSTFGSRGVLSRLLPLPHTCAGLRQSPGSSSCLPDEVYSLPLVFHLSPRCLPDVTQMSPSCGKDVVSQLSPSCLAILLHLFPSCPLALNWTPSVTVVLQNWVSQPQRHTRATSKGYVARPTVQHLG